jgi:formamidopyrimidine-DNA glycosylase
MLASMPELAEVEYYRRCWDCGIGQRVLGVELHSQKRSFRGNNVAHLVKVLSGATLQGSEARGKQILFRFSRQGWLGVHLGMTGVLRVEAPDFAPAKHDHLVLRQRRQALCFSDPRLFGRILFHHGSREPDWWSGLSPALTSELFTLTKMGEFLARHPKAPIKAVLLMQQGFPGIGNWMADEILWRAGIRPTRRTATLSASESRALWRQIRWVCAGALRIVAKDYSDPPPSWLFRYRWKPGGRCPKDEEPLGRTTVGGRTTVWCPTCQRCPDEGPHGESCHNSLWVPSGAHQ